MRKAYPIHPLQNKSEKISKSLIISESDGGYRQPGTGKSILGTAAISKYRPEAKSKDKSSLCGKRIQDSQKNKTTGKKRDPVNITRESKSLSLLSDKRLLRRLTLLDARERKITLAVLTHLAEIDRRELYLSRGCCSLFEFCRAFLK